MMENPQAGQNPENQQNPEIQQNNDIILNTSNEHTSANVSVEETAVNVHKKRENKKFLSILLISIIGIIILVVALFLVFGSLNKMTEYTNNEEYPLYQYFAGQKNVYTGKATISKENGITQIKNDDGRYAYR